MMPRAVATHFSELLLFVLAALEHTGFETMMHFGTLLGAARLGGPLPWDEDHDVYLLETEPAQVGQRLGPLLAEHGFVLSWDANGFFWVREKLWPADSGHLALHFLPPLEEKLEQLPVWEGGAPHLLQSELRPLRPLPYYSSYVWAPQKLEELLLRLYGRSGERDVMSAFQAPPVTAEFLQFWGEARSPERLDWPAISQRFRQRSRWKHLLCAPWWWFNGGYILAINWLRRRARSRS